MSKKLLVIISFLIVILLTISFPSLNTTELNSNLYSSAFGFPLAYFTLYGETMTNWFIPKLFVGNEGLNINPLIALLNVLVFFYLFLFIKNKLASKSKKGIS